MQMKQVESSDLFIQRSAHWWRVIEPAQRAGREVMHEYAINVDGMVGGNSQVLRAVDRGGEDVDLVSALYQSTTQPVHGVNQPAIAPRRQIGRDDVQDSQ